MREFRTYGSVRGAAMSVPTENVRVLGKLIKKSSGVSLGLAQFALAMHAGLTLSIPAAAARTARGEGVRGSTARWYHRR
jgi:hypothetical protein